MPASTMEPITGVLRNAFQGSRDSLGNGDRSSTSLESGLQAAAKKTLLAPVSFDPPVRAKQPHELPPSSTTQPAVLSGSQPPQYIVLNPGYSANSNGNEQPAVVETLNGGGSKNGSGEQTSDPTSPPRPKVGKNTYINTYINSASYTLYL